MSIRAHFIATNTTKHAAAVEILPFEWEIVMGAPFDPATVTTERIARYVELTGADVELAAPHIRGSRWAALRITGAPL